MLLTRYRYQAGRQCHLRLWNDLNAPHLATDKEGIASGDDAAVRRKARARYPGGVWVSGERGERAAETRRLAEAGIPAVFGATFECEGAVSVVEVMEQLSGGGWRLVRVKAAKEPKPRHDAGLAFDLWASRRAGFDVRDAGLLVLNGEYLYDGVRLDPVELFRYYSRLTEIEKLLPEIAREARAMRVMGRAESAPAIAPGDHCRKPFPCSYYAHCTRDQRVPMYGIDELPGLKKEQRKALRTLGIEEIEDIPPDFELGARQRIAWKSVVRQRPIVHGDLAQRLDEIESPVRHLDFETYMPPIPRFPGTRPMEAIPFLFSVHTEEPGSSARHEDYLHEGRDDPRPALTRRLLAALGDTGTICVYSHAERGVLSYLARTLPEYAADIDAVKGRLCDLLLMIRKTVYDRNFRKKFSIKRTLPALRPGVGYEGLEVSDGRAASTLYGQVIERGDEPERRRVFARLRKYCERDTLALVELHRALRTLAAGEH